ncbi:teichoic acid biosynthesis protein C [Stackebrandtia soli]|uniref:phage baseplate protein n=1 Tax=Stackebrandtia soli TaxID=1892856 RepID=UPI0039E9086F
MTSQRGRAGLSRRGLLYGGGALAAVTALGGGALWGSSAFAEAQAAAGPRFKLSTAAVKYIREKPVHHTTVLQSFAFDNPHKHIYVLQVVGDGSKGDMCLTKINYSGTKLGYMFLRGFGHGVGMGVEPVGADAYIWTETDSNPSSGYGRAITRFKFVNKKTLTYGSSSIPVHRPVKGSTSNQPSVDMLNKRLVLRHRVAGVARYRVYDLADAKAGKYGAPLYEFPQVGVKSGEVFQGFCSLGDYVYQMVGTSYTGESGSNPPSKRGNTYLSSIDMRTGALVERRWTQAAYSLDFREPEGMAVQLTSKPRLFMGFASGRSGARKISLYYKPS